MILVCTRTVFSWFHHRIVTTTFYTRSYRKYPPLVSPFHKIRTPTSKESNEAHKEKQGETIEWVRLVYLRHITSYHRGVCGKCCLSSCILLRLQGFQLSDNLPYHSPGIWCVLDLLSLRNTIFSTLLAPNLARSLLTTNFGEENILFLVGEKRKKMNKEQCLL